MEAQYRKREYLSYSTLLSFARCPRKYFYQKSGVYPQEESNALLYGTAMHKAVDITVTQGIDAGIKAFADIWDDSLADAKRSYARACAQLRHYALTHEKGRSIYIPLPPPEGNTVTADQSPLEISFAIDIGLPIPLTGRIDGWGMHRDTKKFWGREFKTMSRMTSSTFDGLEMNPQILTYALVLRTLTGKRMEGVMFDTMLIDPKKVDNIVHPVYIQDHHIDDILVWLRYHGELLLACEARGEFPKNFAGCSAYPLFYQTGSHCEYQNLCRAPDWKMMLPYYRIKSEYQPAELRIEGEKVDTNAN